MHMKRLNALLFLCAFSSIFACNNKTPQGGETPSTAPSDISLSVSAKDVDAPGGSFDLTVTSPTRPSVSCPADWVRIPEGTYNKETYKITYKVTVAANEATSERTANVTLTAGSLSKSLTINQAAAPEKEDDTPKQLSLDKHSLSLAQKGGSASVIVTTPEPAELSGVPEWLEVTITAFKNYKMKFTFKAGANDSYDERSAEVTVFAGSLSDKVVITQDAKIKDPEALDNAAWARGMELGLGWNLGNHFDAYTNDVASENAWGAPSATQATFNGLKAKGFTSVRIPITWLGHIGAAPDYTLDEVWLNRVAEVVGYAENAGLKAIINTHHDEDHGDGHWLNLKKAVDSATENTKIKEEFAAVWTQIANKFKDKGDFLMFESFNELIYGDNWDVNSSNPTKCGKILDEWNQVFVDAVRATGGNNETRWLGVPGYAASPNGLKYINVPDDPAGKTMLAFHCYDPYDYTIGNKQLADWGHTGTAYKNGENEINALMKSIYETYIAKNVPIYMGEFGCSMRSKSNNKAWAFYLYYLEYFVKCARSYGIAAFLWDNAAEGAGVEHHPYINHGTGAYMENGKEPVEAMVKAWSSTDPNYTLQSVYDSAPQF